MDYSGDNDTTVRTLTIGGSGTYDFAGSVGSATNQSSLNLTKSGTGRQTFSGTTYLGNLEVSGGNLVLSGTANIAGTTTVTGGTLDLSAGTTTLGGALTLSGGSVAIGTLGDETNAAVAAAGVVTISNSVGVTFSGTVKNGTYAIFSGSSVSLAENALTLSATNSGYEQTWTTNGNVTYVTISGAENSNLVWAGGTDSWTWNTSDTKWKLFGAEGATPTNAFKAGDDVKFATAGAQIVFGDTAISAGAITIAADTTFSGTPQKLNASSITILDGATLTAQSSVWARNNNGGGISGGIRLDGFAAKLVIVGNSSLVANVVSGTGTVEFNQTDTSGIPDITVANLLTGGISVEKTGAATLTLSGAQSYTGGTKLTEGILQVKNNSALGSGTLTLNGGTLQAGAALTLANAVNVAANSTINTQTYTLTLNGAISGTGATLAKTGTGTLVVSGGASGEKLSIEGGELQAIGSASVTNPLSFNDIVIKSGANLYLNTQNSGDANSLTWSRLTFEGGTFHVYDTQTNTNFLTVNDVVMNGAGTITSTWSDRGGTVGATLGNLSGTGNLTITNTTSDYSEPLAWKISQIASDYSGTISLVKNNKALTVSIGSSSAEGANFDVGSNAALKFTGTGAYSLGTLTMGSGATLSIASSDVTLKGLSGTGAISLADGREASTLTLNQASDTTFSGTIADGIALKKAGAGTLILNGDNSAYTGTVTLEAGTLGVGHANALGRSTVNVTGDAKLALGDTINNWNLGISNNISIADSVKLTLGGGYVVALNGAITGSGTLRADMPGHVVLGGDNSEFSGVVEVVGTTVDAAHASALGTGILKISSADPLAGAERTSGTVQASAANVALHDVSIELVRTDSSILNRNKTTSGSFTVAAGATLYLDIGLLTEATLTGEQVALTIAAASAFDNSFFSAVEVGTYVDDAWKISSEWKYLAGSWDVGAGTLKISAIPEPSVFGLLAGLGALALAGTRRRRRK